MGLFGSLLGKTGPGKLMAAQNALVAKYMAERPETPGFDITEQTILKLLINGGMRRDSAIQTMGDMNERQLYIMVAAAYNSLGIPPSLKGVCFRDNWNFIERPLIALNDAEKEITMAKRIIQEKHGITIDLD